MRVIVGQDAGAVVVLGREMGGRTETICAWMRAREGRMARRDSLERTMMIP